MMSLIMHEKLVASTCDLKFICQREESQSSNKLQNSSCGGVVSVAQLVFPTNVPTVKITSVALCQRCGRALAVGDAACATNCACDGVHTALSKETGVVTCSHEKTISPLV